MPAITFTGLTISGGGLSFEPDLGPPPPTIIGTTWAASNVSSIVGSSTAVFDSSAYATNQYILGRQNSNAVLVSSTGSSWSTVAATSTAGPSTAIAVNGANVLVGSDGNRVGYSTDSGSTFSTKYTMTSSFSIFTGAAYGNGYWMVSGTTASSSARRVYGTSDPTAPTWANLTSALTAAGWSSTIADHVRNVRFLNDRFFVVGEKGAVALTTNNGTSWTYTNNLANTTWGTGNVVNDIAFGNGTYVAVGTNGSVATSTNGTTWTYQTGLRSTTWSANTVNAITWTGNNFVAVGANSCVATSTDGANWTFQSQIQSTAIGTGKNLNTVFYGNGRVVVGATNSLIAISTS